MAKITVTLRCQIDNGKEVINPGETVSMDEAQARNLAAMGMVELPEEAEVKPAKQAKKQGKQAPAPDKDPNLDDDSDGQSTTGEDR